MKQKENFNKYIRIGILFRSVLEYDDKNFIHTVHFNINKKIFKNKSYNFDNFLQFVTNRINDISYKNHEEISVVEKKDKFLIDWSVVSDIKKMSEIEFYSISYEMDSLEDDKKFMKAMTQSKKENFIESLKP